MGSEDPDLDEEELVNWTTKGGDANAEPVAVWPVIGESFDHMLQRRCLVPNRRQRVTIQRATARELRPGRFHL